jgi:hypothetical protein
MLGHTIRENINKAAKVFDGSEETDQASFCSEVPP